MKVKDRIKSSNGSTGKLKADLRKVLAANLKRQAARALKEKKKSKNPALKVHNVSWGAVYTGKPKAIIAAFGVRPEHMPRGGYGEGLPFPFKGRLVRIAGANGGRTYEAFVSHSTIDLDRSAQVREAEQAVQRAMEVLAWVFHKVRQINPQPLSAKLGVEAEIE